MKRLAIVTSHPIQYNAPLFRLLSERNNISIKVFYTLEQKAFQFDQEFGKKIEWDLPLLEGYEFAFISNGGNEKRGFWDVRNPGLEAAILEWRPDAVLVYGWNYLSHFRIIRFFKKSIPVFFRGDSTNVNRRGTVKSIIRKYFLGFIYGRVNKVFYVGTNNKEYYRAVGLKDEQMVYAPHSVDNVRFTRQSEFYKTEANELRNQLGIPGNAVIFLFAGKFYDLKQPEILLKAFIQLNPGNAHLVLVGDGILKSNLEKIAGSDERIHFLPFQNQSRMPLIYQLCDVFCLTSKSETWGLGINEAMACRKAILASTRVGCAVDLIKPALNGFIFESGNQKDLVAKMLQLLSPEELKKMGSISYDIIQAFTFEKIAEAIESVMLNQ